MKMHVNTSIPFVFINANLLIVLRISLVKPLKGICWPIQVVSRQCSGATVGMNAFHKSFRSPLVESSTFSARDREWKGWNGSRMELQNN